MIKYSHNDMDVIIMDKVLRELKNIAARRGFVNRLVLFGSRARGDNEKNSDYDIAVFSTKITDAEKTALLEEIDAVETLSKIDVVFIKPGDTDTELYQNIIRDGVDIMNKFAAKLENYKNALGRLRESIAEAAESSSLTMRDGVIQRFEFTAELSWKTMREYLLALEVSDINNPRNVLREALSNGLISDGDGWLALIRDRNATSHVYDEKDADEIYMRIKTRHIKLFDDLLVILLKK